MLIPWKLLCLTLPPKWIKQNVQEKKTQKRCRTNQRGAMRTSYPPESWWEKHQKTINSQMMKPSSIMGQPSSIMDETLWITFLEFIFAPTVSSFFVWFPKVCLFHHLLRDVEGLNFTGKKRPVFNIMKSVTLRGHQPESWEIERKRWVYSHHQTNFRAYLWWIWGVTTPWGAGHPQIDSNKTNHDT